MTYRLILFFLFLSKIGFAQNQLPLIPYPKEIKMGEGTFTINSKTIIKADEKSFEAKYLQAAIQQQTGINLPIIKTIKDFSKINFIEFISKEAMESNEKYHLLISKKAINIEATDAHGIFNGIQTLLQLIPFEKKESFDLSCLNIFDEPKYSWRGMHLDVSRHFFPKEFIKKYLDYMAMYKMNTFHWHLTDDQGWRIEIKKYPKLTEIGAWRKGSMVGHYRDQKFDSIRYGGFYTQEDIKEIVAYAKARHITVVPEIEMPGHSQAVLAAYPELSCTGGPFEVATKWGILEDVYCPKEETFEFLENVLTEVMILFPSQYIHIGGDECPKTRWKKCLHCQALIKKERLKDEHELQSYFIKRMEKFVNSKGRQIIGWDEILEGGLAPNAAVMSWRGIKGGIAAAKEKHFVVMTPGSHCYFDHYQGEPKNEPVAIGGYTPVEKVYSYQPTPAELSEEEAKYILGAQGNVWTEYINNPGNVEYMAMPRMAALSEVVWGTSDAKNYKGFQDRLLQHFSVLDKMKVNYSKAIFEITSKVQPSADGKSITFELNSPLDNSNIRFTTDGTNPTNDSQKYTNPLIVEKSTAVKAAYFESGKQKSAIIEQPFFITKSTAKKIILKNPPHDNYSIGGAFTLVNGMRGDVQKYGRDWLGFWGKDLEAIIDLGSIQPVSKLSLNTISSEGSWIYYPATIEILVSNDGENFKSIKQVSASEIITMKGIITVEFKQETAQFIKVIAQNIGKIPDGKQGAGSDAWLFVDEIMVE